MKKGHFALLIGLGLLVLLAVPLFSISVKLDLPPATRADSAPSVSPMWIWGWLIYLLVTTLLAGVTVVRWTGNLLSHLRDHWRKP